MAGVSQIPRGFVKVYLAALLPCGFKLAVFQGPQQEAASHGSWRHAMNDMMNQVLGSPQSAFLRGTALYAVCYAGAP